MAQDGNKQWERGRSARREMGQARRQPSGNLLPKGRMNRLGMGTVEQAEDKAGGVNDFSFYRRRIQGGTSSSLTLPLSLRLPRS